MSNEINRETSLPDREKALSLALANLRNQSNRHNGLPIKYSNTNISSGNLSMALQLCHDCSNCLLDITTSHEVRLGCLQGLTPVSNIKPGTIMASENSCPKKSQIT